MKPDQSRTCWGSFRLTNPDLTPVTLTLTMPLVEWKKLYRELQAQHDAPAWWISTLLGRMIPQIETKCEAQHDLGDPWGPTPCEATSEE